MALNELSEMGPKPSLLQKVHLGLSTLGGSPFAHKFRFTKRITCFRT